MFSYVFYVVFLTYCKLNAVSYVFPFWFLDKICINVVSHKNHVFSRAQKTGREVLKHWANKAEGLVPHTDAKAADMLGTCLLAANWVQFMIGK